MPPQPVRIEYLMEADRSQRSPGGPPFINQAGNLRASGSDTAKSERVVSRLGSKMFIFGTVVSYTLSRI